MNQHHDNAAAADIDPEIAADTGTTIGPQETALPDTVAALLCDPDTWASPPTTL